MELFESHTVNEFAKETPSFRSVMYGLLSYHTSVAQMSDSMIVLLAVGISP